jgi:PTH1 family peptidyl-tRNA hydrolase
MNNSGLCSRKVLYRYVIPEENLLVVYDDADLPLGTIRFRRKGSSGGHQGMASVIDNIKSQDINRLRIGISKPFDADLTEHVLSDFSLEEKIILNEAISKAASGCIDWVNLGSDYVMRNYNK